MIVLDTNVLIYGVEKKAHAKNKHLVERAAAAFQRWQEANEILVVPAPAAAEFLAGFSNERRPVVAAALVKRFRIVPFDFRAALEAAQLVHDGALKAQKGERSKHEVRTDIQIVAVAIAIGADELVTVDVGDLAPIAGGRVNVVALPPVPEQTADLFPPTTEASNAPSNAKADAPPAPSPGAGPASKSD